MEKNYSITSQDNVTVVRFASRVDLDTAKAAIHEAALRDTARLQLFDFSPGGRFDLNSSEIQQLADFGRRIRDADSWKVAIVAPEDLDYGLLRMYRAYRDQGSTEVRHHVFRECDEALAWLRQSEQ